MMSEEKVEKVDGSSKRKKILTWFLDLLKGALVGLSSNIPGGSGGTTALIVGIYDRLINAVASLIEHFKESFLILLPIGIGVIGGFAATIKPMELAMGNIPFGISCVFVGLILGTSPILINKVKGPVKISGIIPFIIGLGLMIGLCFIPGMAQFDLSKVTVGAIFMTLAMGIVASFALIIPGVSGAMLLFVFGFYNPILGVLNDFIKYHNNMGLDVIFIIVFVVGVLVGFFGASKAMKFLLTKYSYQTYMGICGFVLGSIFSIFYPFIVSKDTTGRFVNGLYPSTLNINMHIVLGVILLVVISVGLFFLTRWAQKKKETSVKEDETR